MIHVVEMFYTHSEETPAPVYGLFVGDHFIQPYGYAVYRAAGTRDWLIMCTIEGQGCVMYDDTVITVGSRDIVLIPPDTTHQYSTVQDTVWDFQWAHFIPREYWVDWLRMIQGDSRIPVFHIEEDETWKRTQEAFARSLADCLSFGPLADELALNGLEEVLLTLARSVPVQDKPKMDPRVVAVLQYMTEHFVEPLTVSNLAALVDLSPSRLSHLFKDQIQDSIANTLIHLRLRRAARLLQFTSRKVADIADEVGVSAIA